MRYLERPYTTCSFRYMSVSIYAQTVVWERAEVG